MALASSARLCEEDEFRPNISSQFADKEDEEDDDEACLALDLAADDAEAAVAAAINHSKPKEPCLFHLVLGVWCF